MEKTFVPYKLPPERDWMARMGGAYQGIQRRDRPLGGRSGQRGLEGKRGLRETHRMDGEGCPSPRQGTVGRRAGVLGGGCGHWLQSQTGCKANLPGPFPCGEGFQGGSGFSLLCGTVKPLSEEEGLCSLPIPLHGISFQQWFPHHLAHPIPGVRGINV